MTLEYSGRLLCLCLAAFFLVHLAVGLMVSLFTARAVKMVERTTLPASQVSGWLLTLRLLPPRSGFFRRAHTLHPQLFVVGAGYGRRRGRLRLSGFRFSGAGSVVYFVCAAGLPLPPDPCATSTAARVNRVVPAWKVKSSPVWVMEGTSGSLMLAGILRPRLFVSRKVMSVLLAGAAGRSSSGMNVATSFHGTT